MGVSPVIAAAIIGATATAAGTAATVYTANQGRKEAEDAANKADNLAEQQAAEANKISDPDSSSATTVVAGSEKQAASAGGSIVGNPQGNIGDASNATKKTLLGS